MPKPITAAAVARTKLPGETLHQQHKRTGVPYKTLHRYATNGFPKRVTAAARVHAAALGLNLAVEK